MAGNDDLAAQIATLLQNKTPDEIKSMLFTIGEDGKLSFSKITNEIKKATDTAKDSLKNLSSDIRDNIAKLDLPAYLNDIKKGAAELGDQFDLDSDSLKKMAITATSLGLLIKGMAMAPEPKIFANFGKNIEDASDRTVHLTEQMGFLVKSMNLNPSEGFGAFLMEAAKATDSTRRMENALIESATASGQLGTLIKETGNDFSRIDEKLVEYVDLTTNAADATGLTSDQVSVWADQLNRIPGALSSNITLTNHSGKSINVLTAALQTAAGSGMEFRDVFGEINSMYGKFGEEGGDNFKKSLEYVSSLSQATSDLKIPLSFVKDYTDNAADAFKFFGNNSQAAINIISRLGPALKDANLGPEAIAEMTGHITENIKGMDLAQRSFLSSQAGGPGGLRGGYQIELLKSQGKIDEVQKMTEQALRKEFGGRIVTLEEAAKDEGAARQLAKQVQLATQGPTKVVNSEAEAYKLFDAMKKGISNAPGKENETVLVQAMDRGHDLQKRTNTILNAIYNQGQSKSQIGELAIGQIIKGTIGPGEGDNTQSDLLEDVMNGATNRGRLNTLYRLNRPGTEQENVTDVISNMKDQLINEAQNGGAGIKNLLQDVIKKTYIDTNSNPLYKAVEPNLPSSLRVNDGTTAPKAEINVSSICPECQKKTATMVAAQVFDNKIALYDKGKIFHNHTGSPTSTG